MDCRTALFATGYITSLPVTFFFLSAVQQLGYCQVTKMMARGKGSGDPKPHFVVFVLLTMSSHVTYGILTIIIHHSLIIAKTPIVL